MMRIILSIVTAAVLTLAAGCASRPNAGAGAGAATSGIVYGVSGSPQQDAVQELSSPGPF